jgi:phage tail-like protein
MPETGARTDPYSVFNFLVEIDGVTVAGFSECSGLTNESDPIDYREGNKDTYVTKLSGLRKFPMIVLKRGFTDNHDLWEWRRTVIEGRTERHTGVITLLNEAREPALRFNFREGWPSKWEGPSLNAKTNDVAIETLEICHEGLELE